MKYENAVYANKEQMKGFTEGDHSQPISMVNLLKFKEKAEYPDGRETDLTGAEAYAIYGAAVTKLVKKLGGEMVFAGAVERLALGEVEELWDQVAIARYPNRKAMLDMIMSPAYAEISPHRDAGLAGQLNIETTNAPLGSD
jgi:uncharacterized protein (DUF1330 family)